MRGNNHGLVPAAPTTMMPFVPRTDTRDSILDAAEILFSQRGYNGVSVREIVEQAGVNIAAVNYHFGSKMDLYVQTVRRALERSNSKEKWSVLDCPPSGKQAAANAIARFVRSFLIDIVQSDQPSAACSLIMREAAQPSDAVEAVLRDFIQPNQKRLTEVIAILRPEASRAELRLYSESLMGQILHYRTFREFLGRMWQADLSSAESLAEIAEHIARFSLGAIGCDGEAINCAIVASREHAASNEGVRSE